MNSPYADLAGVSGYALIALSASWASQSLSSSYALSASWAPGTNSSLSASWASQSISSSYAQSSSIAITASFALNAGGTGLTTGSTYPITSSWSVNTVSASTSLTSSYFYSKSGSAAWKIFVDMLTGDLTFEYS